MEAKCRELEEDGHDYHSDEEKKVDLGKDDSSQMVFQNETSVL